MEKMHAMLTLLEKIATMIMLISVQTGKNRVIPYRQ